MAAIAPICDFGWKAPDFSLPGVDGKRYTFDDIRGEKGTVVVFICNHCPYVKAIIDRLVRDAKDLQAAGIGFVAISSNDAEQYPQDSFEKMKEFAAEHGFTFPYLYDEAPDARRELYEAMMQVAETGRGPEEQTPSMGCSIKWKPENWGRGC